MRRRAIQLAILVALAAGGCSIEPPLARPSPFDPNATEDFWITGPDSVHGAGTKFEMRLEGTVPLPPPESMLVGWHSSDPRIVAGGAGGEFLLMAPSSTYMPIVIRAEHGDKVSFAKTIYVGP